MTCETELCLVDGRFPTQCNTVSMDVDAAIRIAHQVVLNVTNIGALLGNGLVIASVRRFDFLKTSANFLIAALAASDVTIACSILMYNGELFPQIVKFSRERIRTVFIKRERQESADVRVPFGNQRPLHELSSCFGVALLKSG